MNIYYTDITHINKQNYEKILPLLSAERKKKAERYVFFEDKKRCMCAEMLLLYGLYQKYGRTMTVSIAQNEFGKPFCTNLDCFYFNISHAGKWVVIAVGDVEVGIDIEEIKPNIHLDKCFTENEISFINDCDIAEYSSRVIKLWSMKESYVKFLGTGLYKDLATFYVNSENGQVTDEKSVANSKIKSWLFDTCYYMSVCCNQEIQNKQEVDFQELDYIFNLFVTQRS